jgi:hypothetical protein
MTVWRRPLRTCKRNSDLCHPATSSSLPLVAEPRETGTHPDIPADCNTNPLHTASADRSHAYVVNTVLGWYRDGADVAAMMPRLSTYLGHNDPEHTFWDLSAAPELMALAGDRLHAHLNGES